MDLDPIKPGLCEQEGGLDESISSVFNLTLIQCSRGHEHTGETLGNVSEAGKQASIKSHASEWMEKRVGSILSSLQWERALLASC
jgi:hypothetical protein